MEKETQTTRWYVEYQSRHKLKECNYNSKILRYFLYEPLRKYGGIYKYSNLIFDTYYNIYKTRNVADVKEQHENTVKQLDEVKEGLRVEIPDADKYFAICYNIIKANYINNAKRIYPHAMDESSITELNKGMLTILEENLAISELTKLDAETFDYEIQNVGHELTAFNISFQEDNSYALEIHECMLNLILQQVNNPFIIAHVINNVLLTSNKILQIYRGREYNIINEQNTYYMDTDDMFFPSTLQGYHAYDGKKIHDFRDKTHSESELLFIEMSNKPVVHDETYDKFRQELMTYLTNMIQKIYTSVSYVHFLIILKHINVPAVFMNKIILSQKFDDKNRNFKIIEQIKYIGSFAVWQIYEPMVYQDLSLQSTSNYLIKQRQFEIISVDFIRDFTDFVKRTDIPKVLEPIKITIKRCMNILYKAQFTFIDTLVSYLREQLSLMRRTLFPVIEEYNRTNNTYIGSILKTIIFLGIVIRDELVLTLFDVLHNKSIYFDDKRCVLRQFVLYNEYNMIKNKTKETDHAKIMSQSKIIKEFDDTDMTEIPIMATTYEITNIHDMSLLIYRTIKRTDIMEYIAKEYTLVPSLCKTLTVPVFVSPPMTPDEVIEQFRKLCTDEEYMDKTTAEETISGICYLITEDKKYIELIRERISVFDLKNNVIPMIKDKTFAPYDNLIGTLYFCNCHAIAFSTILNLLIINELNELFNIHEFKTKYDEHYMTTDVNDRNRSRIDFRSVHTYNLVCKHILEELCSFCITGNNIDIFIKVLTYINILPETIDFILRRIDLASEFGTYTMMTNFIQQINNFNDFRKWKEQRPAVTEDVMTTEQFKSVLNVLSPHPNTIIKDIYKLYKNQKFVQNLLECDDVLTCETRLKNNKVSYLQIPSDMEELTSILTEFGEYIQEIVKKNIVVSFDILLVKFFSAVLKTPKLLTTNKIVHNIQFFINIISRLNSMFADKSESCLERVALNYVQMIMDKYLKQYTLRLAEFKELFNDEFLELLVKLNTVWETEILSDIKNIDETKLGEFFIKHNTELISQFLIVLCNVEIYEKSMFNIYFESKLNKILNIYLYLFNKIPSTNFFIMYYFLTHARIIYPRLTIEYYSLQYDHIMRFLLLVDLYNINKLIIEYHTDDELTLFHKVISRILNTENEEYAVIRRSFFYINFQKMLYEYIQFVCGATEIQPLYKSHLLTLHSNNINYGSYMYNTRSLIKLMDPNLKQNIYEYTLIKITNAVIDKHREYDTQRRYVVGQELIDSSEKERKKREKEREKREIAKKEKMMKEKEKKEKKMVVVGEGGGVRKPKRESVYEQPSEENIIETEYQRKKNMKLSRLSEEYNMLVKDIQIKNISEMNKLIDKYDEKVKEISSKVHVHIKEKGKCPDIDESRSLDELMRRWFETARDSDVKECYSSRVKRELLIGMSLNNIVKLYNSIEFDLLNTTIGKFNELLRKTQSLKIVPSEQHEYTQFDISYNLSCDELISNIQRRINNLHIGEDVRRIIDTYIQNYYRHLRPIYLVEGEMVRRDIRPANEFRPFEFKLNQIQ